jgi:hypothetical protein
LVDPVEGNQPKVCALKQRRPTPWAMREHRCEVNRLAKPALREELQHPKLEEPVDFRGADQNALCESVIAETLRVASVSVYG